MPVSPTDDIRAWEDAVIDFFVSIGASLGIQRSFAQIFGLLYCSNVPLSMEDIMLRLQISKGSASQGLKQLTLLGAARKETVIGERRSLYSSERSLKRLGSFFLNAHINPRLEQGAQRLREISALVPEGEEYDFARTSTAALVNWNAKTRRLVPILARVLR